MATRFDLASPHLEERVELLEEQILDLCRRLERARRRAARAAELRREVRALKAENERLRRLIATT